MENMWVDFETFCKKCEDEGWDELLLAQYAVLFRRWDYFLCRDDGGSRIKLLSDKLGTKAYYFTEGQWKEHPQITIGDILRYNIGYINKALPDLFENIVNFMQKNEVKIADEVSYYTDRVYEDKSILDIFFCGNYPMLNVTYYEVQTRPSQKLKNHKFHFVFDEVGTGKTVSALYCIRDVLMSKEADARILIVCPFNKKSEWVRDVQRQLGLYACLADNVCDKKDNSEKSVYSNEQKRLFFKSGEPFIFVEGQKQDEMVSALNKWNDSEKWDLVIIDEAHLCFGNYSVLKGNKAVMLTATPIVINSGYEFKIREFSDYIGVMKSITESSEEVKIENLFHPSEYATQLFREDLGINPKKRNIQFITCERWKERQLLLDILEEAKGGMTRLLYEQDDEFLIHGVFEKFKGDIDRAGYIVGAAPDEFTNTKYGQLRDFLNGKLNVSDNKRKSYIIFFNSRFTTKKIYEHIIADIGKGELSYDFVAYKFGGEYDIYPKQSISESTLYDFLQKEIDNGRRVLFLTTGATGGTGLNLGSFDGVINYELPFTCTELEQRFGRVDRMDKQDSDKKDMVFILNDDYNPMLRYSALKITETARYMPVRNTVLFYPEFIEQTISTLTSDLKKLSDTSDDATKCFDERVSLDFLNNDDVKKRAEEALQRILKGESVQATDDIELNCWLEFIINHTDDVEKYLRCYAMLSRLREDIAHWINLLNAGSETDRADGIYGVSISESADESAVGSAVGILDEYDGNIVFPSDDKPGKSRSSAVDALLNWQSFKQKCEELQQTLSERSRKTKQGTSESIFSGIYYIDKDGNYKKSTVDEFRKNRCAITTQEGELT